MYEGGVTQGMSRQLDDGCGLQSAVDGSAESDVSNIHLTFTACACSSHLVTVPSL